MKSNEEHINEIVYLINLYAFSKYKTMDRIISKRKEVDNLPEQDRLYIDNEVKRILEKKGWQSLSLIDTIPLKVLKEHLI